MPGVLRVPHLRIIRIIGLPAIPIRKQMYVGIHCDLNTAVPRLLLNVPEIGPVFDEQGYKGVPQIMEPDVPDARLRQTAIPAAPEIAFIPAVALRREEHRGRDRGLFCHGFQFANLV